MYLPMRAERPSPEGLPVARHLSKSMYYADYGRTNIAKQAQR